MFNTVLSQGPMGYSSCELKTTQGNQLKKCCLVEETADGERGVMAGLSRRVCRGNETSMGVTSGICVRGMREHR